MKKSKIASAAMAAGWLFSATAIAQQVAPAAGSFVVSDIRLEGLQRVSPGSVFAALPISVNDRVDPASLADATKVLFRTGNFDDIKVARDGSVVVISVRERPSISEISIEGNKAIKTENLLKGLKTEGLSEGQVFKRSTLENIRVELQRQYASQGRYDAQVDARVEELPRNRVAVKIDIDEGSTAAIKHINIVGNSAFSDEELLGTFSQHTTGLWSWLSGDDKYAKEKLTGDLEKLTSHYMDRGYLKFAITSTQVAVSPDRKSVYISVNVSEGEKYTVSGVDLAGDIILPEAEMRQLLLIDKGQTFSQRQVTATEEAINKRLGNDGYLFAKARGLTEVNEEKKTVALKFYVDSGKRTYVRQVSFRGNTKTVDEVLRREMRQMESAPANGDKIQQSRVRLDRLGYFKDVKVDTPLVPGHDDMVDVEYSVEEQPSGSIGASVGYAQGTGFMLGANLQQNNFLGTGKQVGFGATTSRYQTVYNFSYVNPYFTADGVSRGFSLVYRQTDLDELDIASYATDTIGASMNFGYPINEITRLGFSVGVNNTTIDPGMEAPQELIGSPRRSPYLAATSVEYLNDGPDTDTDGGGPDTDTDANGGYFNPQAVTTADYLATPQGFLDRYGDTFTNYSMSLSWNQSTLNRGQLATRGFSQSASAELSVPGSDLEFYKLGYNGQLFVPLNKIFTLRFRGELGYGDGIGDLDGLPFFENYFSGGFNSIRGFKNNTLGPRSTPSRVYAGVPYGTPLQLVYLRDASGNLVALTNGDTEDALGGNALVEGSVELLFPLPFVKDQRSIRTGVFLDAGNVFNTSCDSKVSDTCYDFDAGELRYSAGFGLTWITGFGPLSFSLAKALNADSGDDTEVFQFSIGRGF